VAACLIVSECVAEKAHDYGCVSCVMLRGTGSVPRNITHFEH